MEWLDKIDGLNDDQKNFVTENKFENFGSVIDAYKAKETPDWKSGLNDDLKGLVESKGFKDVGTLVDSYRNLERLKGVPENQLLRLPEKSIDEDPEAWQSVYKRLGRPEAADGYDFKFPEGQQTDEKTVEWLRSTFHELGITKAQGEKFVQKWNESAQVQLADLEEQAQIEIAKSEKALKTKWGMAYDQTKKDAIATATKLGINAQMADQLAGVMGQVPLMEFLDRVAKSISEPGFVDGDSVRSGLKTPDAARYEMNELMRDEVFRDKVARGDREATEKWARVQLMAFGEAG